MTFPRLTPWTALVVVAALALLGYLAHLDPSARTAIVGAIATMIAALSPALVKLATTRGP